ncbi:Oxidoreductase [Candidatus Sulfotelmatomonas gaucii]|uniref:Oxidoreductase n=1 Tax=Candidatus Sulfuritelmatomonas gaucii TaxID=2043161 RepID=A0A2N9L630_9BACT|nr:Oxidoreductase [Candidatus Sulfotelmatomonas gaucii]
MHLGEWNLMNPTGNTILITGGGSGIGRGLAESLHALGNQVIIAGRRQKALDETTSANPGMKSLIVDMQDPVSIRALAARASAEFPSLNILINNAGIQRAENLLAQQSDLADAEATIATNLLGPMRLTAALLPHLQKQPRATVLNVSSGLAFMPMARTPTYCATKAAIHSYTVSLRAQLRSSNIEVLELIPPWVATGLGDGENNPRAMPLDKFIAEAMEILKTQPTPPEICVDNVKGFRFAAENGNFDTLFARLNATFLENH